jgi:hypothetical protein
VRSKRLRRDIGAATEIAHKADSRANSAFLSVFLSTHPCSGPVDAEHDKSSPWRA